MGLLIGDDGANSVSVDIDGGFTTTLGYVHIVEYYKTKNKDEIQLAIKLYKSQADRDAGEDNIKSVDVKDRYILACTIPDLEASDLYTVAYGKLKAQLEIDLTATGKIYDVMESP